MDPELDPVAREIRRRGGRNNQGSSELKGMEHLDELGFRVSFPGPIAHHDVVVNGWRVPFLRAHLDGEDRVTVVLDRRLAIDLSTQEAERLIPFVADAIAVALGYGAHPDRDSPPAPVRAPYPRPERVVELFAGAGDAPQ